MLSVVGRLCLVLMDTSIYEPTSIDNFFAQAKLTSLVELGCRIKAANLMINQKLPICACMLDYWMISLHGYKVSITATLIMLLVSSRNILHIDNVEFKMWEE